MKTVSGESGEGTDAAWFRCGGVKTVAGSPRPKLAEQRFACFLWLQDLVIEQSAAFF